jgi:hypothetical protein
MSVYQRRRFVVEHTFRFVIRQAPGNQAKSSLRHEPCKQDDEQCEPTFPARWILPIAAALTRSSAAFIR